MRERNAGGFFVALRMTGGAGNVLPSPPVWEILSHCRSNVENSDGVDRGLASSHYGPGASRRVGTAVTLCPLSRESSAPEDDR